MVKLYCTKYFGVKNRDNSVGSVYVVGNEKVAEFIIFSNYDIKTRLIERLPDDIKVSLLDTFAYEGQEKLINKVITHASELVTAWVEGEEWKGVLKPFKMINVKA